MSVPRFVCVLNDGDTWTALTGCIVLMLNERTFVEVAEGASVASAKATRDFNLTSPIALRALADVLEARGCK